MPKREILMQPIAALHTNPTILACLQSHNIFTVADLVSKKYDEILLLPNLGALNAGKIRRRLKGEGLSFEMDLPLEVRQRALTPKGAYFIAHIQEEFADIACPDDLSKNPHLREAFNIILLKRFLEYENNKQNLPSEDKYPRPSETFELHIHFEKSPLKTAFIRAVAASKEAIQIMSKLTNDALEETIAREGKLSLVA